MMARADGRHRIAHILIRPFQRFFETEAASGILLLASAAAAVLWANSPQADAYFRLWGASLTVAVGPAALTKPLLLWINDGLMAVFFFVIGLELKREVLTGELSAPRQAALAVAAAAGGMLVPAGIYALLNSGGAGAAGWGIPMATDIAFVLGVLALLGPRVPLALKVFLTAVAIVDDLGAVLVIALFYTADLSLAALGAAAAILATLLLLNRAGVRRTAPYALLGIALWAAVLASGVHATVAGVLLALTIPARRLVDAPEFLRQGEILLAEFRKNSRPGAAEPTEDQRHALLSLTVAAGRLETPLQRLEHALHPWVAYFIVPVFALANAGVTLGAEAAATLADPIALGVVLGLLLGKQLGVVAFAMLATRLGLPGGVSWLQIWGMGLLSGIGFTMSLFIAGLAFEDPALLDRAKIGILAGSLLSAVAGATVLVKAVSAPRSRPGG
jgi:Na+:H+ antiporter, NhaA family